MKKILTLIITVSLISCNDDEPISDNLLDQMNTVYQEIEALIDVSCSGSDQCVATPIGVKPCGGPTKFIVHSNNTDENQLGILVEKYNSLNAQYNEINNLGSDCSIETPPTIECVSGECQGVEDKAY
ncbi:hypothetical protein [Ekhidna sp.]|uniref:hypothetical protein n=1 Tax=Ekhidna sp. TaxID=2608089 RepID=UPI003B510090